jgi:heme O synthase-like polyprenyltransferase
MSRQQASALSTKLSVLLAKLYDKLTKLSVEHLTAVSCAVGMLVAVSSCAGTNLLVNAKACSFLQQSATSLKKKVAHLKSHASMPSTLMCDI